MYRVALDALLTAGARWDRWETPLVDPLRFLATVPRPIRQDKACFRQDQLARLEVMVQHGHTLSPHAAGLVVFDAIGSMERTTSPDLIARLIDLGADPFVVAGDDRRTALHQAMKLLSEDRAAHAHALLDRGLDPLARDAHGLTPVDLLLQRLAEETWVSDIDRMLLNRLERGVLDATLAQHNRATLASSTPRSRL